MPPAISTCAMIQPPKTSPSGLRSAGMGMTRSTGCLSGSVTGWSLIVASSPLQIVEGAAGVGREAGAENHAGIGQIGIGDDAFAHAAGRRLQQRFDDTLGEPGWHPTRLRLHRLALVIGVETAPAPLAQMPRADQFGDLARRLARRPGQALARRHRDVQPDGIGELYWPHRHAERQRGFVYRLRRKALVYAAQLLQHVRG